MLCICSTLKAVILHQTREMCLFSRGDRKKSKVQARSVHFWTPGKASLRIPTAGHALQLSTFTCCRCSPVHVHSARATSFTKISVPFFCPRFIAHIFMIATNCCRISKSNFSAHKSCQTPEEDKSSTWMMLRTLQKRRMMASLFFSMA